MLALSTHALRSWAGQAVVRWALLLPLLPLAGQLAAAVSWDNNIPGYRHQAWTHDDGLPSDRVNALLQTRDGYLWVGTRGGLARFDGLEFLVYNHLNVPELAGSGEVRFLDECTQLVEDSEGNLWMILSGELFCKRAQTFVHYPMAERLGVRTAMVLTPCRRGGVWAADYFGIKRYESGKFKAFPAEADLVGDLIRWMYEDAGGRLWVGTLTKFCCFDVRTGQRLHDFPKHEQFNDRVGALIGGNGGGGMWALFISWIIGRSSSGIDENRPSDAALCQLKDGQWFSYPQAGLVNAGEPVFILPDRAGNLWVPRAQEGLSRFRDGQFHRVAVPWRAPEDFAVCMIEDREGSFWIGTEQSGLHRLQPRRLLTYTAKDGLPDDEVWTGCELPDGSVWIGGRGGVSHLNNGRFVNYTQREGLARNDVHTLAQDSAGTLWVGTGNGLDSFSNGKFTHHRFHGPPVLGDDNEIGYNKVRALLSAQDGSLWVSTARVLHRLWQGRDIEFGATNMGDFSYDARVLLEDHAGNIWAGRYGVGLNRISLLHSQSNTPPARPLVTTFTLTNGLSSHFIYALHEDAQGILWIGTDRGLNRLRDGQFRVVTKDKGLPDNLVNCIMEDRHQNLWIGCSRGIYRASLRELNNVIEGRIPAVKPLLFDAGDGLRSIPTEEALAPFAGWKSRDGRLWMPTARGLAVVDPEAFVVPEAPTPVVIQQMRVNGQVVLGDGQNSTAPPQMTAGKLEVPPGGGHALEFRYWANDLTEPEASRFKYRLDPYDTDWTDAGARRVAYYSNLRPGSYRFQVIARDHHGTWNTTGATLPFYLAPYFYQTWWFRFVVGVAALLVFSGLYYWRVQLQDLRHRAELLQERARIARELHDDLGANLTQASHYLERARRNAAPADNLETHVRKAEAALDLTRQTMSQIIWAADPKRDNLAGLVAYLCQFAEEFLEAASVRCRLDVPDSLPPVPLSAEARHRLFLAAKEALNNSVKHARASGVSISVSVTATAFTITLEDDGCGFVPAAPNPTTLAVGNGLCNVRQHVESLGGRFGLESQPGMGTRVIIEVPCSSE
ncbi:MAG: sensor histidine kinase [Limisphaerales bacterium]